MDVITEQLTDARLTETKQEKWVKFSNNSLCNEFRSVARVVHLSNELADRPHIFTDGLFIQEDVSNGVSGVERL